MTSWIANRLVGRRVDQSAQFKTACASAEKQQARAWSVITTNIGTYIGMLITKEIFRSHYY